MSKLREDAEAIWRAGVAVVDSQRLVEQVVAASGEQLTIGDLSVPLAPLRRIAVVGTGKAGAGMAAGIERALGPGLLGRVTGWVNVPADCVRPLEKIRLHAARPAGVNEPTEAGVEGALEILKIVSSLDVDDLCVVLISGGGSALMPAPAEGITLEEKQIVTRHLMHAGATINELNCVRKQLSRIKGGNLVRATKARTVSLIISDVIGDPMDIIASGPTVPDTTTPADALAILRRYGSKETIPPGVWQFLESRSKLTTVPQPITRVHNFIIGNNDTALEASATVASRLGYGVVSMGSENRGEAKDEGRRLAEIARAIRNTSDPVAPPACVLSGGEPVVHLADTDQPRKGGRNQELALAALDELTPAELQDIVVLSGGTDGEDGPTDAAGGVAALEVKERSLASGLNVGGYLSLNNSYEFLSQTGGLFKTGPTHTNVMDLRVILVASPQPPR
ncbi:MAG: DUF4147 domain-containing protein [Planctomycetota bacterium]|nr:DUF4147 domain-containing protein [Planctomycetota bacterium]